MIRAEDADDEEHSRRRQTARTATSPPPAAAAAAQCPSNTVVAVAVGGGNDDVDDDLERPATEMPVAESHCSGSDPVMEQVVDTTRRALYRFFYPAEGKRIKK